MGDRDTGDGKPCSMLCQQVQGHFAKADVPKPGHAGGGAQPTAARTFARDKRTDNVCAVSGSSGFHHTAPEKLFFISLSLLLLDGILEQDQKSLGESWQKGKGIIHKQVKKDGHEEKHLLGVLSLSPRTHLFCTPLAL